MKTLYVDAIGGAAGDMLVAALVDAGAPAGALGDAVAGLGVGAKLRVDKTMRGFLAARRAVVDAPPGPPERHLPEVLDLLARAGLPERAEARARATFEALARAEARVHGVTPAEVHFHEVGAVDAIVDILCVCLALDLLAVERLVCSPLPLSRGTAGSAHGALPLPAPAVLELLAEARAPIEGRAGGVERVTPTAAALLATLADDFGPFPGMTVDAVGYGAGSREALPDEPPNVVRAVLGRARSEDASPRVVVLECNLDDQSPEAVGYLADRLREAGALDVALTPTLMKKGRPGVVLTALCEPARAGLVEDRLLLEGGTLGVRRREEARSVLPRERREVETPYGPVRVKLARRPDGSTACAPEHDDVVARARAAAAPYADVYRAALRAAEG